MSVSCASLLSVMAFIQAEVFDVTRRSTGMVQPSAVAKLVIQNATPCDIAVYINDGFAGICPAMTTLPLQTRKQGVVRLRARSRCDDWGPVTRSLTAGEVASWRVGYDAVPPAAPKHRCAP